MARILIINFHRITDGEWFKATLEIIGSKWTFVPVSVLEELCYEKLPHPNVCHITFDDGDRTFYDIAFPVLKKMSVPASLYFSPKVIIQHSNYWFQEIPKLSTHILKQVIVEMCAFPIQQIDHLEIINILKCLPINKIQAVIRKCKEIQGSPEFASQNITLSELNEIASSELYTIGAHTLNHPVLKNEDDRTAAEEISGSIIRLAEMLDTEIKHFAFPNGIPEIDFGEREICILRKEGIKIAFTVMPGYNNEKTDPYNLRRIGLSGESKILIQAKLVLGKKWNWLKSVINETEYDQRRKIYSILASLGPGPQ